MQKFGVAVIELKITKGCNVFVFEIWSVFEKYLQIQSNTHKNYQRKVKQSKAVNLAKDKIPPTMCNDTLVL